MLPFVAYGSTKLDTLYYDKDWKGVSSKPFATFYRIVDLGNDSGFKKLYRDFYITGELQAEGEYVSIDRYDDSKSVFTGQYCTYYKSGKIEQKGFRNNGIPEGEYNVYYENGLIQFHAFYSNGQLNGIATSFSEDGSACRQDEYDNGKLKYDYYIVSNKDGYISKYKVSDNSPIWEIPTEADLKTELINDIERPCYVKNGLVVSMINNKVKDYGKYYQSYIIISNHSMVPVEFDPDETKSAIFNAKGEKKELKVLSCYEYMKKVDRKQSWNSFWVALGEGLAAAGAGYSTSTTNTNTYYNGSSNTLGLASAYGSGGYAHGMYSGNSTYSGSVHSTSTTVTYDRAAAYQASVMAGERLAAYDNKQLAIRNVKEQGYLKKMTIYPGETISGYINIQRLFTERDFLRRKAHKKKKNAQQETVDLTKTKPHMYVEIYINKIPYCFSWDVGKKGK